MIDVYEFWHDIMGDLYNRIQSYKVEKKSSLKKQSLIPFYFYESLANLELVISPGLSFSKNFDTKKAASKIEAALLK